MTSASDVAKKAQKFTIDNSPVLLTVVAAVGVIGTAYLAARGGYKSAEIIADKRYSENIRRTATQSSYEPTFQEKLALTWKSYVPACGVGLITVASVVGSNKISTSRSAAMAAAFTISEKAFVDYREKVVEQIGKNKAEKVDVAVAQDRVDSNPPTKENIVIVTNDADQIFQDSWSGRYFRSNMEAVNRAVNDLNHQLNVHGYSSLTDFYEHLGLSKTQESDEVGWTSDNLLEVGYDAVIHDSGQTTVMAVKYRTKPIRDYYSFR